MPAPAGARAEDDTDNCTKAVGPQLRCVQEHPEASDGRHHDAADRKRGTRQIRPRREAANTRHYHGIA